MFVDLDNDGIKDYMGAGTPLQTAESAGHRGPEFNQFFSLEAIEAYTVSPIDFDSDGDMDVVYRSTKQPWGVREHPEPV